jgi:uncharacterized membrane protein
MNALLPLHLLGVGLWLGCVLTEVLFERALLGKGRAQEALLADLHRRVDVFVEVPAFVLVLVSGAVMLSTHAADLWLHAKIGFGVLAIAANVYCVWLVFARARAAQDGRWDDFDRIDARQHRYGAVVLVAMLAAIVLGLLRLNAI